ncbi:MAG: DUF5060 domain-containing protein [Puniceicoccaceae bacterium]
MKHRFPLLTLVLSVILLSGCGRQPDPESGGGGVSVSGELKTWHNVILTLDGPFARESDNKPNPFTDYQMDVVFTHESGEPSYKVPGYFAADGNAAETSADSGTQWRAHLSPDKTGEWSYAISFSLNGEKTEWDGISGNFNIGESDKTGRDFRGKGRLTYVGERYLKFAGSGEYFLKAGADAPETLLAYTDFDGTYSAKKAGVQRQGEAVTTNLKTWEPHVKDWNPGDPSWQGGKGKGLIGAVNYLAGTGCNAFSFLPYNAGGDGDNVWPHVSRDDKLHMDCSKLDQWGILFSHATANGMYLHFKLQETENDDLNTKKKDGAEQALDDGNLGPERKLYLREMIARFGHNLALNWNIGEENTQTVEQIVDMIHYIREVDPYGHNIVLHTYPNQQEEVYGALLGNSTALTGLSIQNSDVSDTHREAVTWSKRAEAAGHPWVVAHDESGNAQTGTPPDPDYPGMAEAVQKIAEEAASPDANKRQLKLPTVEQIRSEVLWGNILAGGTGVEYYFGYKLPENDLGCQDWRSRARTWKYSAIALKFFQENKVPFWEMQNMDELVGNPDHVNFAYCFAKPDSQYLVYYPAGNVPQLDLSGASGRYSVKWFNPREGGGLMDGSVGSVTGGGKVSLGNPPSDASLDWLIVLRK